MPGFDVHDRGDLTASRSKWQATVKALAAQLAKARALVAQRTKQLAALTPAGPRLWMPGARQVKVPTAGAFLTGRPKGVLHTTEGKDFAAMDRVLRVKHAEPHFLVGRGPGQILQYIPLNAAAKALEHVGMPETNRAHAIQIEVCWNAAEPDWPPDLVANVRRVMRFIEANTGVRRECTVKFTGSGLVHRLASAAWLSYNGWCGHQHVPNQPSGHWDPGAIKIGTLL